MSAVVIDRAVRCQRHGSQRCVCNERYSYVASTFAGCVLDKSILAAYHLVGNVYNEPEYSNGALLKFDCMETWAPYPRLELPPKQSYTNDNADMEPAFKASISEVIEWHKSNAAKWYQNMLEMRHYFCASLYVQQRINSHHLHSGDARLSQRHVVACEHCAVLSSYVREMACKNNSVKCCRVPVSGN